MPKANGMWMMAAGIVGIIIFVVVAVPALREQRVLKGGSAMGRAVAFGPVGLFLLVLGVIIVFIGH